MANEARVTCSLYVRRGSLFYQSQPSSFQADVSTTKGPSPGAITVSTDGTDVDLSQLVTPGLCRLMNLDDNNYVQYGIWDPTPGIFYPLGELLPGEFTVLRLSRNLGEEYTGVGTGTTAPVNSLRIKADTAACVVLVEAFEK
jgi:hypothetical protein